MLYETLLGATLVTILQVRRHIRAQEDSKILISRFTCRDRGKEVIGGLISGRNLRGVRELLFKFHASNRGNSAPARDKDNDDDNPASSRI